jgi:hypothetical protein
MLTSIVRLVSFCARHASWVIVLAGSWVIVLAVALTLGSALYTARHFAIKTDVTDLFPSDLPWTRRAFDFTKAFPQPDILVVIDAPTPELVERATTRLALALTGRSDTIRQVHQLDSGPFFEQNGLLFLPTEEVARLTGGLIHGKDLIQTVSADPSLRGSLDALSFGLIGVEAGVISLDNLASADEHGSRDRDRGVGRASRQLFLASVGRRPLAVAGDDPISMAVDGQLEELVVGGIAARGDTLGDRDQLGRAISFFNPNPVYRGRSARQSKGAQRPRIAAVRVRAI